MNFNIRLFLIAAKWFNSPSTACHLDCYICSVFEAKFNSCDSDLRIVDLYDHDRLPLDVAS